jgi:hypothetical protein
MLAVETSDVKTGNWHRTESRERSCIAVQAFDEARRKQIAVRPELAERSQNREFLQGREELFRMSTSAENTDGLVDEHRLTRRVRR